MGRSRASLRDGEGEPFKPQTVLLRYEGLRGAKRSGASQTLVVPSFSPPSREAMAGGLFSSSIPSETEC